MTQPRRIYLDNAATTWPKPEAVYDAVDHYQRHIGAPNGRSGYREAQESNRIVERVRRGVADIIGASEASHIILGLNCSDMLNIAIRGAVRPGDHVVTTVCDHNSVLRPLRMLSEEANVEVTYVPCDSQGFVSPDDIKSAIRAKTRLVAVNHASNVTGAIQAIDDIGRIVRTTDALFLVDAAQSLGHVPVDVRSCFADLLAAPGHKGLLGPLGTGILYIRPGIESEVKPLRLGGTGTQSDEDRQPDVLPQKYEPGNHNLVGLAGLVAATEFLREETIEAIHAHHSQLARQLTEELSEIEGVTIHGPKLAGDRTSVVSVTVDGYEPQELAAILDSTYRIQTRAGFQCAPRMHEALGIVAGGGTLRFSPGFATTAEEITQAVNALQEVAAIAIK
ncbi:MAG TPA: aminotransferase class V-fold PLP-dependent enzyme [Lacipirellulaceae bacterium]|nr:aminotransferase class V-fold PLP-dependent enzyme [Lacipirellulaceae bacterium]